MRRLRHEHPYEFFTRGSTIKANVESVKRHRWDYEPRYTEFTIPGAVQDWLDTEFAQEVSLRPPFGGDVVLESLAARALRGPLLGI